MDLRLNINGLNNSSHWKEPGNRQKKNKEKKQYIDEQLSEPGINDCNEGLKRKLIYLQDSVTNAQDKINILELANKTLEDISGNLHELKEKALNNTDKLDGFTLSKKIKQRLENIDKLEKIRQSFKHLVDDTDIKYTRIVEEFNETAIITIELAKSQRYEENLNSNTNIENILNEINKTIYSISLTQDSLSKVQNSLINNIINLSIALENMVSSYGKIRNLELASETVKLTESQILNEAKKSIKLQAPNDNITANKLVS